MEFKFPFFGKNFSMETTKGKTYFDDNKLFDSIKQYPYLDKDIKCDILIIGGGIQGAIVNYFLSQKFNCILVDKARLGRNSTCVATALLEFQLDDFAKDLKSELDSIDICHIYKMGLKSLAKIKSVIQDLGNKCNYRVCPSLLYSNRQCDVSKIQKEFKFRKSNGFDCKFVNSENNPYPFDIKAGIFDKNGGAEFNPYLFEKQLIESATNGEKIFENTEIVEIKNQDQKIIAYTKFGNTITANKVIITTGFDYTLIDQNTQKLMTMDVSYTIVTKPINGIKELKLPLIQDTLTNYHYLRVLKDNRIIFGGEDEAFGGELDYNKANKKYLSLLKNLKKMFHCFEDKIEIEYSFCGLFASTTNNLGIIGKSGRDNIYYFLSCGANGIINTFCGVDILLDLFSGKSNEFEKYFSPQR